MATLGERIAEVVEEHGESCGCVVCRCNAGEPGARANVYAAMLLGCDFHGIQHRKHNGIPSEAPFGVVFSPHQT